MSYQKTELLKPNNYNIIVLLLEQVCNIVKTVVTMYRMPNSFKCKFELIPEESYVIIWWMFIMF